MTVLGDIKRVPEGSKSRNGHKKTYLVLLCDQCGKTFEQGNNIKLIRSRPRHYCTQDCHMVAMKRGGIADASRKSTCKEKYGSDYLVTRPDVASRAGKLAHAPGAQLKRNATNKKNLENYSIRLKRGLVLCRSKAEIDFLTSLAAVLETELLYQDYQNGWWIDAYSPQFNCWIQFDGVFWHSKPRAIERDRQQNEWFKEQGKTLFRVTDVESRSDSECVLKLAEKIKESIKHKSTSPSRRDLDCPDPE